MKNIFFAVTAFVVLTLGVLAVSASKTNCPCGPGCQCNPCLCNVEKQKTCSCGPECECGPNCQCDK